jgi:hypothetical protein
MFRRSAITTEIVSGIYSLSTNECYDSTLNKPRTFPCTRSKHDRLITECNVATFQPLAMFRTSHFQYSYNSFFWRYLSLYSSQKCLYYTYHNSWNRILRRNRRASSFASRSIFYSSLKDLSLGIVLRFEKSIALTYLWPLIMSRDVICRE